MMFGSVTFLNFKCLLVGFERSSNSLKFRSFLNKYLSKGIAM